MHRPTTGKTEPTSNGGGTTGITDLGREEKLHNCSQRQDWEYVRKQLCRHQCQWKRKGRSNPQKTNKHLKKLWRKRCPGGAISTDDIEQSHIGNCCFKEVTIWVTWDLGICVVGQHWAPGRHSTHSGIPTALRNEPFLTKPALD